MDSDTLTVNIVRELAQELNDWHEICVKHGDDVIFSQEMYNGVDHVNRLMVELQTRFHTAMFTAPKEKV